jgi:Zn2+/Cd2+-exporting ATPase
MDNNDPHELTELLCSSCQPGSDIPHQLQQTRLRVANLCCAGEERIIRTTLEDICGIEEISVNIIGRYAIIKHCAMTCCAPTDRIVDMLNGKQLGVSIQEANDHEANIPDGPEYLHIFHGLLVVLFFIAAVIFDGTGEHQTYYYIGYIICTAIGLIPILYDSFIALYRRTLDIHILMAVAIAGAIASHEYLDAALVVTLFVLAEVMEGEIMRRVRNAVQSGVGSIPKSAILLNGETVAVDDLKIGDKIAIRAGDMILADGIVSGGHGVVDESALTGEAIPIAKAEGDKVISGTVVQNGYLEVEITVDPRESTVRKLNDKVSEVQADRGQFAKLVDQFAGAWTPFILVAATALVIIGGVATGDWYKWTNRALVLLVLACPCAIVIAAPIPSVCTIAIAARNGVLIKGSTVVENLGVVKTLAVDKTGTLTKGFFSVVDRSLFSPSPSLVLVSVCLICSL